MSEIGFFPHARTQVPTTGWSTTDWNRDIDISAIAGVSIPAGMDTVVIEMVSVNAIITGGVQSSDDTGDISRSIGTLSVCRMFVRLNESRTLDFRTGDLSGLAFWIVGYGNSINWESPLDVSGQVTATGTNTTITASNISSSEAAFALVETALNTNANCRIYPAGGYSNSTAGRREAVNHNIIPINASKQFEANLGALFGANNFRVLGWLKSQHYHYISPVTQRWPSQYTAYEDFQDTATAGARLACFIPAPGGASYSVGFRKKGTSSDILGNPDHVRWAEPDASGVVEYKITRDGSVNVDYRYALQGYFVNQTAVTITGLDDSTPNHLGSLTITGEGFGATQGAGTVTIGGVSQTVTSWADTSITITVARGTNMYGVALDLVVTNGDSVASTAYSVTLYPQAGWDYVNVGTPNTTADNRITATPDAASGDQLTWDTQSGAVVVYNDLTFSAGGDVTSFDVALWTTGDGWGTTATQTIGASTAQQLYFVQIGIVVKTTNTTNIEGKSIIGKTYSSSLRH